MKPSERRAKLNARWYAKADITWRRAGLLATLVGVVIYALFATRSYRVLENRIALPLSFHVRTWLGKDPTLDPRIKIFVLDDETLLYLQSDNSDATDELPLIDWAKVLESFSEARPKSVFIDKVFGATRGIKDAAIFNQKVSALDFPVVTPAFLLPTPIASRPPLATYERFYDAGTLLGAGLHWALRTPFEPQAAYGPDSRIAAALPYVGYAEYLGDHRMHAYLRISTDKAVPSAALLAAKARKQTGLDLSLSEMNLPLDAEGQFLVNFVHPKHFGGKRSVRLKSVVKAARMGQQIPASALPQDSVIVILTTLFSGGPGQVTSPFGNIPAGHVTVSVINSFLTGQWVRELPGGTVLLVLFSLAGLAAALFLWNKVFWATLVGANLFCASLGLSLFAFKSFHSPWLFWMLGYTLMTLPVYFEKLRCSQSKSRRLKETLEGVVPPDRLAEILEEPESLALAPANRIVTVMFIDVVGFSLVAERQTAEEAFRELKKLMQRLLATVHKHGGVVDKTMGDGMLCFFGYRHTKTEETQDHANQAFRCALEIQRENVEQNLKAAELGQPVYPLRIGINTSSAYIGDLGNSFRIELTLIGHGVNYAQRLESACDSNCIMLGVTTKDMLTGLATMDVGIHKRNIRMKHYATLVEAFECDPFLANPRKRAKALRAYRDFVGIARKENRWPVPKRIRISVRTDHGDGVMQDFSESGFAVVLNRYHATGVTLSVEVDSMEGQLRNDLRALGLNSLYCEVRWSRPMDGAGNADSYVHGLLVRNLSRDQRELLLDRIRTYLSKQYEKPEAA